MTRLRSELLVGALVFAMVVGVGAADASPRGPGPLDRLRDAVEAHPTDPDLRWALARKLAAMGDPNAAVAATREFLRRWPDRRPGARVQIARTLLETGEDARALELLDEELSERPRHGMAHFYRGLAYRSQARIAEANHAFRLAGRMEPSIHTEAMLAEALGLFDLGREDEAVALLKEVLEQDPTGDSAVRARLLLREREVLDLTRSYRIDAYAGLEYDDNVTLESTESQTGATGSDDFKGTWGIGLSGRPWVTERASLTVGYRYDQTRHFDLTDFDVLGNTLFASGSWVLHDGLLARLDGVVSSTLQDLEAEATIGSLRPNLIYSLGPRWGALRAFGQVEVAEYHDDAPFSAWERDAMTYSLGVEHFLPLQIERSWLAVAGSWSRSPTQADSFGTTQDFDGDFDYDRFRARALTSLQLPWELRVRIETSYSHDRYHNDNFTRFLETGDERKRRDDIVSGRIGLTREILPHLALELYWSGTRRISNVGVFDYDKQRAGLVLRASTD